jgi:hypothetical protein
VTFQRFNILQITVNIADIHGKASGGAALNPLHELEHFTDSLGPKKNVMVAVRANHELQEMRTGPDLYEHMEVVVTKGHDKMHHGVVLSSSE